MPFHQQNKGRLLNNIWHNFLSHNLPQYILINTWRISYANPDFTLMLQESLSWLLTFNRIFLRKSECQGIQHLWFRMKSLQVFTRAHHWHLSWMNPDHIVILYLLKLCCNIIHSYMPRCPKWVSSIQGLQHKNFVRNYRLSFVCYMTSPWQPL
jgi:hypothetical protein